MSINSDPLRQVRVCLDLGATIERLADLASVSPEIIKGWLKKGVPPAVEKWSAREPLPTQVQTYQRLLFAAESFLKETKKKRR